MTEYAVLKQQPADEGEGWYLVAYEKARTPKKAIELATQVANEIADGTFVAVPARSWKPVTVKVETKTALKFS